MKTLVKILILFPFSISLSQNLITDIEKYDNGDIKEVRYYSEINNKIELVKVKTYYENGYIDKEGKYENGYMSGKWVYYYDNGQVKGTGGYYLGDGTILGTLGILNILGISRFVDLSFTLFGIKIPMIVAVGVLPYPITFLCTDLISELYGKNKATQLVWIGLIVNLWIIFFGEKVTGKIFGAHFSIDDDSPSS